MNLDHLKAIREILIKAMSFFGKEPKNYRLKQTVFFPLPFFTILAIFLCPVSARSGSLDFLHDVSPLFSRLKCNMAMCHGKAEGQNGFKLSVFGFNPEKDYQTLINESRGRRLSFGAPSDSLLLRKATGEIGHGGGVALTKGTREYQMFHDWIATGAPYSTGERPPLVKLRIEPEQKLLDFGAKQPLQVWAQYADDSRKDVTWQAVFRANNPGMAKVTPSGQVSIEHSIGQASVMARYQGEVAVFQAFIPRPGAKGSFPRRPVHNFIDKLVDAHLQRLNVHPSGITDEATFLRRVHLDTIGKLPTAAESKRFLQSKAKNKRAQLVEALLARPEYADHWALKWSDILRVDRLALGHEKAHAYYQWIHGSFVANKPLDQLARDLLTVEGPLAEEPAGYFYQAAKKPGEMAAMTSQIFLGVRITCAECHQHPYDRWRQQDFHGMRGFFQQVGYKASAGGQALLAEGNPIIKHPRTGVVILPHALGAQMPKEPPQGDRRQALADWMTHPANAWFARNLANRLWAHFLGRGLIEPVDDLRTTNPASNPELLDALARHLIEQKYDMKAMIRLITSSRTYQLSTEPTPANELDEQNYSRALFRRLPAEVLMDAVCDVTGIDEKYQGVPRGYRAVQLWDSQVQHYFLKLFGRPSRTTVCECDRPTGASISQALHLMNSPNLQSKLAHERGRVARLVARHPDDSRLAEELYLTCFSRFPTAKEKNNALEYLGSRRFHRRQAAEDLTWAMLNSLEFIFNH